MIKNLSKPFKWFFQLEAASGLVLLIAAIIALVISNSSLSNFGVKVYLVFYKVCLLYTNI